VDEASIEQVNNGITATPSYHAIHARHTVTSSLANCSDGHSALGCTTGLVHQSRALRR